VIIDRWDMMNAHFKKRNISPATSTETEERMDVIHLSESADCHSLSMRIII
jgi:hypothetical protein